MTAPLWSLDRLGEALRRPPTPAGPRALRVLVVGGGPVGLAFATALHAMMGEEARITVADARWTRRRGRTAWADEAEGTRRRDQVVTLQSGVVARLPEWVREALLPEGGYSEVWPLSAGSPRALGFPRNLAIRDAEDRLLELAREQGLRLEARRVDPAEIDLEDVDVVVIADGPRSAMRDGLEATFDRGDPGPFSLEGRLVKDAVLAMRVHARIPDPDGVVLTVAQNRFLLNAREGEGYLYMRLTPDEAREVRGLRDGRAGLVDCIQSRPCVMLSGRDGLRCATHGTRFAPERDPDSLLFPRMQEGLRLFDVPLEALRAVTLFRLSMIHRGLYVRELTPFGAARPVYGALLGDAAIGVHFWPGQGLNTGLSSAVSLAQTLAAHPAETRLRLDGFAPHVGAMAALAYRNQDRAWRAMVMRHGGRTRPVHAVIADALENPVDDRAALLGRLGSRIDDLAARLGPRLPAAPDAAGIVNRLGHLRTETLSVFVQAGAWETRR